MTEVDAVALTATGLLVVATGLLLVVLARRAAHGRIRRNPIAGIRTAATMASDEAWLAAHRAGESLTALGGWVFVATGAVTTAGTRLGAAEVAWPAAVLIGGVLLALCAVVAGGIRGHRAARAMEGINSPGGGEPG
ncbi:SdpI family protein [Ruania alba]|uniref:SdpI/YhfL protein family protein n=1 Tax=Ruania alba TaxID=648782 RepID=A0A1H5NI58_9MICO|nr:SdpI family protein [Ruania alba]SEF01134.1 SdpI/YhfL protein family protein [Ruania alba]